MSLVGPNIVHMSMNITALVNSDRVDDWTTELAVIASNDSTSKKINDHVFQKILKIGKKKNHSET